MITLRADRLHWIRDDGTDESSDLCAHSPVTFQIGDEVIVRPEDGDWTVSASAIFLLRALDRDHTKESKVGEQVFPCCGHGIYDVGEQEVVICGCPTGIDFEIRHIESCFQLSIADGRIIDVPEENWRDAVVGYSDQVMEFYKNSAPKEPVEEEDRRGFLAMMAEWQHLRQMHSKPTEG